MDYTIFINERPFTAGEQTVDQVIAALTAAGFTYDERTQGYVAPDFYQAA